jgi:hypothetical protein
MLQVVVIVLLNVFGVVSFAQSQTADPVSIEVEPSVGSMQDTFLAAVTFDATKVKGSVMLLPSSDFEVRGRSTQSSQQIINGDVSFTLSYQFQITPKHAGKLVTPTARVQFVDGTIKDYPGQTVEVTQSDSLDESVVADLRFLQSVDQLKAYKGQQIFHSLELQSWVNLDGLAITQPDYASFWVYPFEKTNSVVRTDSKGERYQVYSLNRALFPLQTGTIHLDKATLKANALTPRRVRRGFGSSLFGGATGMPDIDLMMGNLERTPVEVEANDLDIEVLPLPPRPEDYSDWGLPDTIVGTTEIAVDVGSVELKTGESKTLTYRIKSKGNISGLKVLPLDFGAGVKRYDEDITTKQAVQGKELLTQITIPVTLIPLQPGKLRVYQTASVAAFELSVQGASLGNATQAASSMATTIAQDRQASLLPLPEKKSDTMSYYAKSWWESLTETVSASIFLVFFLVLLGLSVSVSLIYKRRSKRYPVLAAQRELLKSETAEALIQSYMSFIEQLLKTKRVQIDKQTNRYALRAALEQAGVTNEECYQIERVLDEFDRFRFGGGNVDKHFSDLSKMVGASATVLLRHL